MKRALLLVLFAAGVAIAAPQEQTGLTNVDTPIYLRPDTTLTPLITMPRDKPIEILEVQDTWLKVSFSDPMFGRRIGYAATKDVTVLRPPSTPVPAAVAAPTAAAVTASTPTIVADPAPPVTPAAPAAPIPIASSEKPRTATLGLLGEDSVREAIALGARDKGREQGLVIRDSGALFAAAMDALADGPRGTNTGFELRLYSPARWVRQLASNAAKEYRTITPGDLDPEHRRLVLRVFIEPDSPTHVNSDGMRFARSAQHVVLKDAAKRLVVQPVSKDTVAREFSNAMGGRANLTGLVALFDMAAVREVRGPKNGEFFVTVIGERGSEREFKVKQKHFERLD